MTIPIKNHEYLIGENIDYHINFGIDAFVILIHNSTDNSREIVEKYKDKAEIHILEVADPVFMDAEFRTRMAMAAKDELGADWVISNDVDEFWTITNEESIKDVLQGTGTNLVYSYRYNVIPFSERDLAGNISAPREYKYAVVNPVKWDKSKHFSEMTGLDYLVKTNAGKAATKTQGLRRIEHGSHDVDIEDRDSIIADPLTILHYPFTTREIFLRETVDKVQSVLSDPTLRKDQNWHVRLLEYLVNEDKLEQFADELFPEWNTVSELLDENIAEERVQVYDHFSNESVEPS